MFWCLLHVSNRRFHIQEDGCIYSYGLVCFTYISTSSLIDSGVRSTVTPQSNVALDFFRVLNKEHYSFTVYSLNLSKHGGTWWRSWLRHCAISRKVLGSIPDGVIGIFHWHNPSGRTVALGSTQPLTEMSTRNTSCGGKGGRCVGLTTLPPSCADCLEIWEPQPPGTLRACRGL